MPQSEENLLDQIESLYRDRFADFVAVAASIVGERESARDIAWLARARVFRDIRYAHEPLSTAEVVRRLGSHTMPLDTPDATPPIGKLGIWLGAQNRIVLVERATTGRRLYLEIRRGINYRTNLVGLTQVLQESPNQWKPHGKLRLGPGVAVQSGAPMRLALTISIAAGLFLAGCSSGEPSAFKAGPTAKCLKGNGYRVTTDDAKVGIIAANAPNGGLRANEPGNALTIAFGQNSDDAIQIAAAFKKFAPKKLKPHITDVMRTQKNAVLLWTVTPPQAELDKAFGCLKG